MRITRSQLKRIIKEELLREQADVEPDGIVPTDAVAQAAAQSAAKLPSKRGVNDSVHVVRFLEDLDEEQMHYTSKRFMDKTFEEWLLDNFEPYKLDKRKSRSEAINLNLVINQSWSGYRDNPPTPFPKARPNVAGQKFAGFARVNNDVFSSDPEAKADAIAEFFKDHKRDPDLT